MKAKDEGPLFWDWLAESGQAIISIYFTVFGDGTLSSQVFLTEEDFIMDKFLDTLQEKLGPIAYKLS